MRVLQTSAADLRGLDWPSEQSRAQQLWARRESASTKWRTSPGQGARWGCWVPAARPGWRQAWSGDGVQEERRSGCFLALSASPSPEMQVESVWRFRGHRGQRKLSPSPPPNPPPSEQWALLLPGDEEEEAGPGLGRIWDSEWVQRGAAVRDSSGVAGQPLGAPWAAGLSSPRLRI